MKTLLIAALITFPLALTAGCASYSGSNLVPGQATTRDVQALMGEPAAKHPADPGQGAAESWEYPRGPAGRHTYMARFDAQGHLLRIDQVLSIQGVARIKIGEATRDDVRHILGRPGFVFPSRGGGEWWDYAAYSADGAPRKIRIAVTFDARGLATSAGEAFDPEELSPNFGGSNL